MNVHHESADPVLPDWRPLIDGALAERARSVVEQIAQAHAAVPLETENALRAAERALFFGYLAQDWPARGFEDLAERCLDRALVAFDSQPAVAKGLHGGVAGIAWVVQHLVCPIDSEEAAFNSWIDEAVLDLVATTPWPGEYDLISGLVGYGVYALERRPHPHSMECLARVVARLTEEALIVEHGVTWLSKPEFLLPQVRVTFPDGYYDLGVAHGVPGVIAFLAAARAAGLESPELRALYEGAVSWTLAQRLGPECDSAFPYCVQLGTTGDAARSAWCYGDPGVAATLYAAARAVGDQGLEREALALARHASERSIETCGVADAGVCHGAAGLAHVYNRLWQGSGDQTFALAARQWIERALSLQRPGSGIAGFQAWGNGAELLWTDDYSFLSGVCGIGLALLAAISTFEPAWDRLLLTSLHT
jgi:hypothetical protein